MDWIHCNFCYTQPGDIKGKKFEITNCGHIYCVDCLKLEKLKECKFCNVKFTSIPLAPKLHPDVEKYFQDSVEIMKQTLKIIDFQHGHRSRLAEHRRKLMEKMKEENSFLRKEVQRLKKELKQKCLEINQLKSSQMKSSSLKQQQQRSDNSSAEEGEKIILKRPPESSLFFQNSNRHMNMRSKDHSFTTPLPPSFSGGYRSASSNISNRLTPQQLTSPITPDSGVMGDPLQRSVKLPGDRGGPSSATRMGLQSLSLSRPMATPTQHSQIKKYTKYY